MHRATAKCRCNVFHGKSHTVKRMNVSTVRLFWNWLRVWEKETDMDGLRFILVFGGVFLFHLCLFGVHLCFSPLKWCIVSAFLITFWVFILQKILNEFYLWRKGTNQHAITRQVKKKCLNTYHLTLQYWRWICLWFLLHQKQLCYLDITRNLMFVFVYFFRL